MTAVVGRSRNNLIWSREFDYGVDGSVRALEQRGTRIRETGLGFDFQSKSTIDWEINGTDIVYDLEVNAYNDLAERAGSGGLPFLLVLLCLPKNEAGWLDVSADKLILQKCAYWAKLDGALTDNVGTRRVRIPVANIFTPEAVIGILRDIKTGAMLP